MSAAVEHKQIVKGGSFLIEARTPAEIFTPEDFNEEHRMIADTTRQFMDAEVLPRIGELENKDWKLARELVKQAAELGLVGAAIPEEFGGLALDQTSGALIAENLGGLPHLPPLGAQAVSVTAHRLFRHRAAKQSICPIAPATNHRLRLDRSWLRF